MTLKERYGEFFIDTFLEMFRREYAFLYDTHANGSMVAGQDEAMDYADKMLKEHPDIIGELATHRGDLFMSDREMMALGFTLEMFGF